MILAVGTKAVIVYAMDGSSGGDVWTSWIDTASAATINTGWSAPVKTVNGNAYVLPGSNVVFDACSLGTNLFAIAYVNNNATTINGQFSVTLRSYDASLALVQNQNAINSAVGFGNAPSAVAVGGDDSNVVWVAYPYNNTTDIRVAGFNPTTLASTVTTANVITGGPYNTMTVTRTGTNTGMLICSDPVTWVDLSAVNFNVSGGHASPVGIPLQLNRYELESRPFSVAGRWYSLVRPELYVVGTSVGHNANQLCLVDWTQSIADSSVSKGYARVVSSVTPRLAYHPQVLPTIPRKGARPHGGVVSSTEFVVVSPSLKNAASSSLDLVTFDFASTNRWQPTVLGESVALSGGTPSYYDGVRVSEIGFLTRPDRVVAVTTVGGTPDGIYKYIVVYEEIDARGQWHQSSPSDPAECDATGGFAMKVLCSPLVLSNRSSQVTTPGQVRAVLYRTTAGGNVFYRVTGSEILNNPIGKAGVTPLLTFADDNTDDLSLGAPCYAQPGTPNTAQVNVSPPSFGTMITHVDRLFGATGKAYWFTKQLTFGEGYAFCDVFQGSCEAGGDITAMASLDGALVIFKRDKIAFVDGSGPPDNGAGGDFSEPQFIAADVGCIEPRSVVVTPAGVMFQSLRGIEMLSRGRSLATYFGAHVEATLAANPVITSAVLDEAKSIVVFTCLPTETASTGVQIVWDYVHNIWLKDTWLSGIALRSSAMRGQGAGTVPVRAALLDTYGVVEESATLYTDNAAYVTSELRTPWVKMGGIDGYGRTSGVSIQFESRTPCDILVTIRQDFRSDIVQTRLFTASEIAQLDDPKELYVTFKTQKCSSFQVELQDFTPTGGPEVDTGQGPAYFGMRIEYQPKAGKNRTSSRVGA